MRKIKSLALALIAFLLFIICQQCFYNSRIPLSLPQYDPPENSSNLTKWGYDMSYAAMKELYEHPERRTDLHPKYGVLGNVILVLRNPENLVQSTVESMIFLLPGFLGCVLGMLLARIISCGSIETYWQLFALLVIGNLFKKWRFQSCGYYIWSRIHL